MVEKVIQFVGTFYVVATG